MKLILVLLFLFSGFCNANDVMYYDSKYKELKVGVSTLSDIKNRFGRPKHEKPNSNNVKYYYRDFDVTIGDETGKINTIIIFDRSFRDKNNIKVGHSRSRVQKALRFKSSKQVMTDKSNGIVYWFDMDENKVSKIVLAHKLKR